MNNIEKIAKTQKPRIEAVRNLQFLGETDRANEMIETIMQITGCELWEYIEAAYMVQPYDGNQVEHAINIDMQYAYNDAAHKAEIARRTGYARA